MCRGSYDHQLSHLSITNQTSKRLLVVACAEDPVVINPSIYPSRNQISEIFDRADLRMQISCILAIFLNLVYNVAQKPSYAND